MAAILFTDPKEYERAHALLEQRVVWTVKGGTLVFLPGSETVCTLDPAGINYSLLDDAGVRTVLGNRVFRYDAIMQNKPWRLFHDYIPTPKQYVELSVTTSRRNEYPARKALGECFTVWVRTESRSDWEDHVNVSGYMHRDFIDLARRVLVKHRVIPYSVSELVRVRDPDVAHHYNG